MKTALPRTSGARLNSASRLVSWLRGMEIDDLPVARAGNGPGLRHPLRREIEHLFVNVRQSKLFEFVEHPLGVFGVGRGADDSPPELMALIAILAGNRSLVGDVLFQTRAVNRRILLILR
jgi:hypothetical protein